MAMAVVTSKRRVMAMMASAVLIGDELAESAMADVEMHQPSALGDHAHCRIGAQGRHRGVGERPWDGNPPPFRDNGGVAGVPPVAAGGDFQRPNITSKTMQNSPDLRFQAGCRRLRLEAETSRATMIGRIRL